VYSVPSSNATANFTAPDCSLGCDWSGELFVCVFQQGLKSQYYGNIVVPTTRLALGILPLWIPLETTLSCTTLSLPSYLRLSIWDLDFCKTTALKVRGENPNFALLLTSRSCWNWGSWDLWHRGYDSFWIMLTLKAATNTTIYRNGIFIFDAQDMDGPTIFVAAGNSPKRIQ
jgi:hypothetical protein